MESFSLKGYLLHWRKVSTHVSMSRLIWAETFAVFAFSPLQRTILQHVSVCFFDKNDCKESLLGYGLLGIIPHGDALTLYQTTTFWTAPN